MSRRYGSKVLFATTMSRAADIAMTFRSDLRRIDFGTWRSMPARARRGVRRSARLHRPSNASMPSEAGVRAGVSSFHEHIDGSLSGRKRMSLVPCRKRLPCTLS